LAATPALPPQFLQTIEATGISMWVRDSPSFFGFWFILSLHAIGMGLLVGASTLICLRLLGVARDLPIAPLRKLYSVIWVGFWLQIASGGLLFIAYPTKSLTNTSFYVKMALIVVGMILLQRLKSRVFSDATLSDADRMLRGKALALLLLLVWVGTVTAGRLIAYTYTYTTYPA
jgi:hypothetical protein